MIAVSAVGVRADNQTIADSIAAGLSAQFPNEDITVQVQDGKVWLSGQVASPSEMLKMIQFVSEVNGVKLIENEMTLTKATVATATGNLPRAEKTEIVQIAMNKPVQATSKSQTVAMPPARQASRIPTKKAPLPVVVVTTGNLEDESKTETILQVGNSQAVPVREANYVVMQTPLAIGAQPVGYVTRGPRDFVQESGQGGVAMAGTQHSGGCKPNLPNYAWPSYAAHPNYSQVTYPKYYKPDCWPNIGPFYPYPQPPVGWRKTTLEWHDGKWWLDFDDGSAKGPFSPIFRSR